MAKKRILKCSIHGNKPWQGDIQCAGCGAVYMSDGFQPDVCLGCLGPLSPGVSRDFLARPVCRGCARMKANPTPVVIGGIAFAVLAIGYLGYSMWKGKSASAATLPGAPADDGRYKPATYSSNYQAPATPIETGSKIVAGIKSLFTSDAAKASVLAQAYCTPAHPYPGCSPTVGVAKATTAESAAVFKAHQARLGVKQDALLGPATVTAHNAKYSNGKTPPFTGVTSVDLLAQQLLKLAASSYSLAGLGGYSNGGSLASGGLGSRG